jgi:hypothetical protein
MVYKKLEKLRMDKATGADNLLSKFLKEITNEISYPLTVVLSKSFEEGLIPEDWKLANVSPVFKKGSRGQVGNYRPISLTSQICKIFESIMRDAIIQHLEKNNLLSNAQHGFRRGRSCLTNLLVFLDRVTKNTDSGCATDVIYLDFAKAFDKVPHDRLIAKLKGHGIDGKVGIWIKEWLNGRKQRVCLQGYQSRWRAVASGVPQGSVLGPVLFLLFINDLENEILNRILKFAHFADDTKLFGVVQSMDDHQSLQHDLSTLFQWSKDWQMEFNVGKCKIMYIGKELYEWSGT